MKSEPRARIYACPDAELGDDGVCRSGACKAVALG